MVMVGRRRRPTHRGVVRPAPIFCVLESNNLSDDKKLIMKNYKDMVVKLKTNS